MTGPNDRRVRQPAVAGMFYPADTRGCRALAESLVKATPPGSGDAVGMGGIVPHAGWVCSGAIAGEVIGALARGTTPDVVVVFGAVHTPVDLRVGAMASHREWALPGGLTEVAAELGESLARGSELFVTDDRMHVREHAVEVEVPLIRAAWPEAKLLPVEVPAVESAAEMGRATARHLTEKGVRAVYLASSDLTHYGPAYRFAPAGVGVVGLEWAKANDRRLLSLVQRFDVDRIVPEARANLNACGAGAIVAMLAACQTCGAGTATVLRHANSYETLANVAPQPAVDAVGYAGVVVG